MGFILVRDSGSDSVTCHSLDDYARLNETEMFLSNLPIGTILVPIEDLEWDI